MKFIKVTSEQGNPVLINIATIQMVKTIVNVDGKTFKYSRIFFDSTIEDDCTTALETVNEIQSLINKAKRES